MKISIITATLNSSATIRDTMKSVLSQGYSDWEHIIVDGCSKDNTIEIVKEMEPQYGGRLRWISEPDKGIYDAMNKGVRLATGDVIGILNSDDFYTSSDVLDKVCKVITGDDIDAVFGDIHYVDDNNLNVCVRYYSSRFFHRWMMALGWQPTHPSFYCRKECYDKYGDFDTSFKIAADFEHMLRLIYINRIRTRYIPMDFVTMRTGGISNNGIRSHVRIIADHYKAYTKHSIRLGYILDLLRYPIKVGELVINKISPAYPAKSKHNQTLHSPN